MAIVTQAEMEAYAQLSTVLSSDQKSQLEEIRVEVEGAVVEMIGYNPSQATYTEFYPFKRRNSASDGDALNAGWADINPAPQQERGSVAKALLTLKNIPIRSIASIYENIAAFDGGTPGGDWPESTLVPATDYYFQQEVAGIGKTGAVIRNSGWWINKQGCIKVTYSAGYTSGEMTTYLPHVKRAVKISVMYNFLGQLIHSGAIAQGGRNETSHSITDFSQSFDNISSSGWGGMNQSKHILPQEAIGLLSDSINLEGWL